MDAPGAPLAGPLPVRLADEIALLLVSQRIEVDLVTVEGGVLVVVAAADRGRAARIVAEEYPGGLAAAAERGRSPARAAPRDVHAGEEWFGPGSWVLFLIAAVSVGVFVAEERAGGSDVREVLLRFGASRPAHVRSGDWFRLVTAMFVHIGPRHLLANVAALLVLGPALALALGPGRFAFVYVAAGIAGNAVSYLLAPSDVVSAGASGAILGVLGALGGQRLRFTASARYRGWQVVAALLAYLAIGVGAGPGIDNVAHLAGLAAGFLLGLIVPPPPAPPTTRDRLLSAACGGLALLIVAIAFATLATTVRR